MNLNDTMDRLAKEREQKEGQQNCRRNAIITDITERIFFTRMLKDINHGMGEEKKLSV